MKWLTFILVLLCYSTLSGQITLKKSDESCEGRKDGRIEVVVEGVKSELDYTWTRDGQAFAGGKIISGLAPGDYAVTVSTEGGCMGMKAAKIWPGKNLSVSISAQLIGISPTPLQCGDRPVFTYKLTGIPSGGTPPYSCYWGGGQSLGDVEGGENNNNCTITVSGSSINQSILVIDSAKCVDAEGFKKVGGIKSCPKDPNDITGPAGYDTLQWISVHDVIDYAIRFENDPVFATSNAAIVFVTVPLDDDIDPFSFRLQTLGFGDKIIEVPTNVSFFQQRIDYTEELGFKLDVTAGLDLPNNRVFWLMETIDPTTGQPPSDPTAGFLPVNDTLTGSGEGFINFSCRPKSTTPTGEIVEHQASIVFDVNDPLLTNSWMNTVDAFAPSTLVDFIPDTLFSNEVDFSFTIEDDPGGCGVQSGSVLLSTDNAVFQSNGFLTGSDTVQLILNWGTKYYYKILGSDFVDNLEDVPADSFYIISKREIEFLSPNQNVFCLYDTLYIDALLSSLQEVDLYISSDSGLNYDLLEASVSEWPYKMVLDTSLLLDTIFIKARNEVFDVESISFPLTVRPLPDVDAGDPAEGCENEILFVEANGANNFLWSPDTIIGNPSGRYSNVYADFSQYVWVQGTDVYGCRAIDSVWLTVHGTSIDTVGQALCEGDSILIDGQWITEVGYYPTTYGNSHNCDSVIVTEVFFESPCIWTGGEYVFVDTDAAGDNNGTSWEDAFNELTDAIYVAGRYENVQEIWVAEGTYHPHLTRRDTSFILRDSIKIYGGFLGIENERAERTTDPELVFLSGDINIADTLWDNSYHTVVMASSCVECVLDGLTIHYGYADQAGNDTGAGILNAGKGQITNVVFERNFATELGAAVYSEGASAILTFQSCLFRLNTSSLGRDVVNINGAQLTFVGVNGMQ